MKEHTDVPQDPFADGIVHPLRDAPGVAPAFPPSETEPPVEGSIAAVEPTTVNNGPIGGVSTTHDNLADCAPNPGE